MLPTPTKHQILVTAIINTAINKITTKFYNYVKGMLLDNCKVVVIQYYSQSSKRVIMQRDNTNSLSLGAMAWATLNKMALSNLDNIYITSKIIKHIRAANTYPYSSIPNKQVQVLKQSYSYQMLRIASYYAKELCQHTNANCFTNTYLIIRDYNTSKVNYQGDIDRVTFS